MTRLGTGGATASGPPESTRTFVVVPHTHWDREWYQPFEQFRARLTRMMDGLLELLDGDPEYRHFVLDGQTVPLDDYLEIRPDRRDDIERLVREGRLVIGPGYMLPDEFLIGAEATIRNLQLGIRSARRYGRVMMVGYAPDAFGHIAHLPAVLRAFGIDSVVIWRGVGREVPTSEFRWAAPDGSEVLAVHLPHGYGIMPTLPEDPELLRGVVKNVRNLLEAPATTSFVLVPNGTDHLPAHTGLPQFIRSANEMLDDARFVHGSYPMFVENVRRELNGRYESLPRVQGEFRSGERSNVLAGVLSTRIWLKQRYAECEELLARWAEPAAVWAAALRSTNDAQPQFLSDKGLLAYAWKLLLQNGPHDSVTGCSVDAVYEDVGNRFDRCQQAAEAVLLESQHYIARLATQPGSQTVTVFNSEHGPRTDFCTARLPLERDRNPVALTGMDGKRIPLQVLERGGYSPADTRERVAFGFVAPDVPGFGYRTFAVEYGEEQAAPPGEANDIENERFRVSADARDGTITVEDKGRGVVLTGLNRFVDGGERGDEYTYCPPDADRLIDAPAEAPVIAVTENGPARKTLEVRMRYALPERLTEDRRGRSERTVDCEIVTRARVYPGVPRVDVETEVENRAEDHRLRVHFPTGLKTDRTCAEQHFGVVERPVTLPEADARWLETPVGTYPQKTFVDVSDGRRGVMISNRGLPEYEALQEADGTVTIALTLLRCISWLSRSDLSTRKEHAGPPMYTPGAQMPGRWTFQYSIIPHEGGWRPAYAEAHRFARPLRAVRVTRGAGALPPEGSLVGVEPGEAVISAVKPAVDDEGIVVRAYNISPDRIEAAVRLNVPYTGAEAVDLNEENPSPLGLQDGIVVLPLRPNQIATVRFG